MTNNTCYYGYISGILTAATLQPLDNIKMNLMLPPTKLTLSSNFVANIYNVARYLHIEEGLTSFYRGLVVNVWKTGLGSGFYFYTLRMMEGMRQRKTVVSSFINSATARVISTVLTNPLAIAETRYQISGAGRWEGRIFQNLINMYRNEGIGAFFKGCKASCMKEAGFAGLYYSLYEKAKQFDLNSLTAGMCAGIISTIATHPLQIIRTNNQTNQSKHHHKHRQSISQQLLTLVKQGKIFDGVTPRLIKKPAANTIGFLLFQYLQAMQSDSQIQNE